jgi:hypothetical protein
MSIWNHLIAILASLSAEPAAIDQERPRAAAAVAFAAGQFAPGEPTPVTETKECKGDNCPAPKGVVKP